MCLDDSQKKALNLNSIGTSGGAITALAFALGLTAKKLEEVVLQYDFTRFMYESNINKPIIKAQ